MIVDVTCATGCTPSTAHRSTPRPLPYSSVASLSCAMARWATGERNGSQQRPPVDPTSSGVEEPVRLHLIHLASGEAREVARRRELTMALPRQLPDADPHQRQVGSDDGKRHAARRQQLADTV